MMRYNSALVFITVFVFAFISSNVLAENEENLELESKSEEEETIKEVNVNEVNENNVKIEENEENEKKENKENEEKDENIENMEGSGEILSNQTADDINKANTTSTNKTLILSCILNKTDIGSAVEIVNATRLSQVLQLEPNVTNKGILGSCVAVLFYSRSCPFSCMAAPHFNALPRFFPDIKMVAVDAMQYRGFNTQYGIVGTPTLLLFHGGRPAYKFNDTAEYGLEVFSNFITKHTGLKPLGKLMVTSADFGGPVSSIPVKETDYYLTLSWVVIALRILYSLYYSTWGRSLVDATLNAWREAEAQHHHVE